MNSSLYLLVPKSVQMTVLILAPGFTEGGQYSIVNNVQGDIIHLSPGHYSLVNNVRGDIFGGYNVHYDNASDF